MMPKRGYNSAGNNPYLFDCPWCGALKGCLCKTEDGIEYTDGSYCRARLMLDCLCECHTKGSPSPPCPECSGL
jgi:hypothetical protein